MGAFITLRNEENLVVSFTYSSLAKRYRQGKFYIINKDDNREVFQLTNTEEQAAIVSKKELFEHSLLLIRLQCIVPKELVNEKDTILQSTLVDQQVSDERKFQDYVSDHTQDPTEYKDKTKYTFVISKYIEISFEPSTTL